MHRGVYTLSERATAGTRAPAQKVAQFVNARSEREIVFVRGATEGLNLVAYAWGLVNLGPGDLVVVTELEHHSNFVPWQYIAKRTGATLQMIPLDDNGELDLAALDALASEGNVKVVANNLVSNSLGTVNPVERLAAWAHEQGAIMVVDGAQAAPHRAVDVQALGCDFLAFSAHKMCGPTSVGALWGRLELLEAMEPFNLGGHMIRKVTFEETTWGEVPREVRGGHAADRRGGRVRRRRRLPQRRRARVDRAVTSTSSRPTRSRSWADVPGIKLYGPPAERRAGIVSFNLGDIHPHDVAQVLDMEGVAIRAGHHCCQPLMHKLGVAATNRASFYLYTVPGRDRPARRRAPQGPKSLRLATARSS